MTKHRKPRTTGSELGFDVSHMWGWAPEDTIAYEKLCRRVYLGQCIACGQEKCRCKSGRPGGPGWRRDPYVMKNFWKRGLR